MVVSGALRLDTWPVADVAAGQVANLSYARPILVLEGEPRTVVPTQEGGGARRSLVFGPGAEQDDRSRDPPRSGWTAPA